MWSGSQGSLGVFRSFRVRGGDSGRDRELRARHREGIVQICGRDRRDCRGYFAYSAYAVATVAGIVSFARGIARGPCANHIMVGRYLPSCSRRRRRRRCAKVQCESSKEACCKRSSVFQVRMACRMVQAGGAPTGGPFPTSPFPKFQWRNARSSPENRLDGHGHGQRHCHGHGHGQ